MNKFIVLEDALDNWNVIGNKLYQVIKANEEQLGNYIEGKKVIAIIQTIDDFEAFTLIGKYVKNKEES